MGPCQALACAAALAAFLPSPASAQGPAGQTPVEATAAEKALRGMGLDVSDASLLKYFRDRTFNEADPRRMAVLLRELGSDTFTAREKAASAILELGGNALFALRQAENDPDTEVKRRAGELRHRLEDKPDSFVQAATARLIQARKPAGAAEVLLAFLPFAADDSVVDEIRKALTAVTVREGQIDPVVVRALTDKVALKRSVAGEALIRAGAKDRVPAMRRLLQDADPLVRFRVALALVAQKEKAAMVPLIDTFLYLPADQLWTAEEMLVRLAGDKAPQVSLGTEEITRKRCRDAWLAWWEKHSAKVDLAQLDRPATMLGYTLLVQFNFNRIAGGQRLNAVGQVLELDGARPPRPRWSFDVPGYPVAGQVVAPDRVLIAEYQGMCVSERDFKGNVKWQKNVGGNPIDVQRLQNGNTFVVMQQRLVEMDSQGKEVFAFQRPHDIFHARKLSGGDVVFITNVGLLIRIDGKTQRELKSFQVGQVGNLFGSFDVLPNGNVVVPQMQANQVVEFSADGQQVWSAHVAWPTSVARLANGHTLVASQNQRRIVVLDRAGREVWSHTAQGMVFQANRR